MQRWWDLLISGAGTAVALEPDPAFPWAADPLTITFPSGLMLSSRLLSRQADDTLRVRAEHSGAQAGDRVTLEWTSGDRGCTASAAIVETTPGTLLLRLDQTSSGLQRRSGVRVATYLPVTLTAGGGVADGRTYDLSIGGTRIGLNRPGGDEPDPVTRIGLTAGDHVLTTVALPTGPIRFDAVVVDDTLLPRRARLQFVDIDSRDEDRVARFVADNQRESAARLSGLR